MKQQVESVVITNEEDLISYINGTKLEGTNSFDEIVAKIVRRANTNFDILRDYDIQIECVKGWNKVHVFSYDHKLGKRLYVTYNGTFKY